MVRPVPEYGADFEEILTISYSSSVTFDCRYMSGSLGAKAVQQVKVAAEVMIMLCTYDGAVCVDPGTEVEQISTISGLF